MGYKNREIEKKLEVVQRPGGAVPTMRNVDRIIEKAFEDDTKDYVEGTSNDTYWKAPDGVPADFGRVREMSSGRCQITAKGKDKGDNVDRIEVDLDIDGTPLQGAKLLEALLGPSKGVIRKTYYVYFLENEHTTVSVYRVHGSDQVFVEVEARTRKRMIQLEEKSRKVLTEAGFDVKDADGSLYEMFVLAKEKT